MQTLLQHLILGWTMRAWLPLVLGLVVCINIGVAQPTPDEILGHSDRVRAVQRRLHPVIEIRERDFGLAGDVLDIAEQTSCDLSGYIYLARISEFLSDEEDRRTVTAYFESLAEVQRHVWRYNRSQLIEWSSDAQTQTVRLSIEELGSVLLLLDDLIERRF